MCLNDRSFCFTIPVAAHELGLIGGAGALISILRLVSKPAAKSWPIIVTLNTQTLASKFS